GYYCGVMGFFDGHDIDSAVLIRYIEKASDGFFYRSGGGITLGSDCSREYQETLVKVYVPVV
ncbi:MAG: chorismate-binding protein, partial [Cyclobacteriaceae bacterium]